MKRCNLWKQVLVHSSRQMCHSGTDTCSLCQEEWAHECYIYISQHNLRTLQRNPKNCKALLLTLQAGWEKLNDSHIGVGVSL